jgi:hypothetical protein
MPAGTLNGVARAIDRALAVGLPSAHVQVAARLGRCGFCIHHHLEAVGCTVQEKEALLLPDVKGSTRPGRGHRDRRVERIATPSQNLHACLVASGCADARFRAPARGTVQDQNQYKKNAGARRVQPKVAAKQVAAQSDFGRSRKTRMRYAARARRSLLSAVDGRLFDAEPRGHKAGRNSSVSTVATNRPPIFMPSDPEIAAVSGSCEDSRRRRKDDGAEATHCRVDDSGP